MKSWKKGAIIGALWGLLNRTIEIKIFPQIPVIIPFGPTCPIETGCIPRSVLSTPMIWKYTIFVPYRIAEKIYTAPFSEDLSLAPLITVGVSLLIGAIIGLIVGVVIDKYKARDR